MKNIWGEISTLNKHKLEELSALYDFKITGDQLISYELILKLNELTLELQKEIALLIDRNGCIQAVNIGTSNLVNIPKISAKRKIEGYSGIRCIHTHPSGSSRLSSADISTLINLKLDSMVALGVGEFISGSLAYLIPQKGILVDQYEVFNNYSINKLCDFSFKELIRFLEKQVKFQGYSQEKSIEKAVLVFTPNQLEVELDLEEVINELINLSKTAGLEIVDTVIQKKQKLDPRFLIGSGKLDEISLVVQKNKANCIIFEKELSPSQQNNLMNYLGIKVLDKTNLILDIFAKRARSKEGQLQVELAQLKYLLPRLSGQGINLSRLGGGVGTRGPGETKLETDRRHIRRRLQILEKDLKQVIKNREVQRKKRISNNIPTVALVGYTNAGKSSLMNVLAKEDVLVENKLFATLDTTIRMINIGNENEILLSDTVGFIRDLPQQLLSAFMSTLEEVKYANLLLHVVDISNKNYENHIKTVNEILKKLKVLEKPQILVFNKTDKLQEEPPVAINDCDYCFVSAHSSYGIEGLQEMIKKALNLEIITYELLIPFSETAFLDELYKKGRVEILGYNDKGTEILFQSKEKLSQSKIKKYLISEKCK